MIASLTGTVRSVSSGRIVLNVGGVGYLVLCTGRRSSSISVGEKIDLETSYIVREDSATLFGFESAQERELFDLLRSVTGVGPKSALAILNELETDAIAIAVAIEDDAAFKAVSGIGPKTAKLIVVTLAGKLGLKPASGLESTRKPVEFENQVIEALVGLGWPERTAGESVKKLTAGQTFDSRDALLRAALVTLGNVKRQQS